ncbi:MAG: winged helix DNA-binding protein [Novosphingobium sp.]|nr:winged helix DNA-binding protein [Novosphingobium sp.]
MSSPVDLDALLPGRALVRANDPPGMISSLRALARAMLAMTEGGQAADRYNGERRQLGDLARALHRERARRTDFFADELFGEPAWDILLDLYAASRANELRSIKAVCLSSQAADATALRYIDLLAAHGLVERKPDRTDRRRKYLSLTPLGERKMHDFLASMPPIGDSGEDLIRHLVLSG